jgi:hypothetical protein
LRKDAAKIGGEMPHFNNSTVIWKRYAYTFQRDKNYLFYCSVFLIDCIFVSKNEDQTINLFCTFRQYEQQVLSHKDRLFSPLHTGLLEKWGFQIMSVMKLKLQDMTAESLSATRTQRMNRDTFGIFS